MPQLDPLPSRAALLRWAETALGVGGALEAGLPRRAQSGEAPLGAGVWCAFESCLAPTQRWQLWCEASLAVAMVDRSLGGEALLLPSAHPAAALDEAERGVLAYALARACTELDTGMRLAALGATPTWPLDDSLCWGARWRIGAAAEGALRIHAAAQDATALWPAPRVRWVLAAEPGDTQDLAAGDVMLLDTPTTAGWLRVEGLSGWRPVQLEGTALRGRRGPAPPADSIQLELAAGPASWEQLADIHAESSQSLELRARPDEVRLRVGDREVAEGELVRLRGRTGVRITRATIQP